jgi:hypothetical protein
MAPSSDISRPIQKTAERKNNNLEIDFLINGNRTGKELPYSFLDECSQYQ